MVTKALTKLLHLQDNTCVTLSNNLLKRLDCIRAYLVKQLSTFRLYGVDLGLVILIRGLGLSQEVFFLLGG